MRWGLPFIYTTQMTKKKLNLMLKVNFANEMTKTGERNANSCFNKVENGLLGHPFVRVRGQEKLSKGDPHRKARGLLIRDKQKQCNALTYGHSGTRHFFIMSEDSMASALNWFD